jgi:LysR family transcriptional regulator, cyn operon transcriptional activator
MELNYLRAFYEVAKSGSFTEAARKLHISQSALSKAVALLEEQQGVKLFIRSKRGITLTPTGDEVFLQSERLFALVIEIEASCRGRTEIIEGPLYFGASDHVANYLLVSPIQQMLKKYPGVLSRVASGTPHETVDLILRNEIEFGLFFTKLGIAGVRYETLSKVEMTAVVSPPTQKKLGSLKEIVRQTGFIGSIKAQYQHHPSKDLMQLMADSPRITLESNSQEMQKRFCLAGGGVAYLARFMVEKELHDGTLVEIPLKKKISIDLHLATRKGRELSLTARTFLNLLRSQ